MTGVAYLAGNNFYRAFYWNGTMSTVGVLPVGTNSIGFGINDGGRITGQSEIGGGAWQAFVWDGSGGMTGIPGLGGTNSYGRAINAGGGVTGQADVPGNTGSHAFYWDGVSAMQDLGTLGGTTSYGYGINGGGAVVGSSALTGGAVTHAFLWAGGVMSDLNNLLVNGGGWVLTEARGINDSGWIAGTGTVGGETHAFLLTPVEDTPEAGTVWVVGTGLAGLMAWRRITGERHGKGGRI